MIQMREIVRASFRSLKKPQHQKKNHNNGGKTTGEWKKTWEIHDMWENTWKTLDFKG